MSGKTKSKNILPKEYENHSLAKKYKYYDFDEELGIVANRGFWLDDFPKQFLVPLVFCKDHDCFKAMKEATVRKGDYMLLSPAKTGTHWVWEIMSMLVSGSTNYRSVGKETTWIDVVPLEQINKLTQAPAVLNTHLMPSALPDNIRLDEIKTVITLRNLKDVFVSMYHHRKQMHMYIEETWQENFTLMMYSKLMSYGNYFDVYADIWDNYKDNPNVLIVFYEDLKQEPKKYIEAMAKHMEVPYTKELIEQISEAVMFENMAPAKRETEEKFRKLSKNENATLYRKGQVGDWKNLFTVAQNEEFHAKFDEWNKERKIPMRFE